jgi:hypothetical protein
MSISWDNATQPQNYTYKISNGVINAFNVVKMNSSGSVSVTTSNDVSNAYNTLGVSYTSTIDNEECIVYTRGEITHIGWSFAFGLPIFIGDNGELTQIRPSTGFLQKIANVVNGNTISIDLGVAIILS